MAYATLDEKTLYIQGGTDATSSVKNITQFFSLDLTQSWNTSNPPWKSLPIQHAPSDYWHTMTISKDKQSLIVWGSNTEISTYRIAEETWSISPMPSFKTTRANGFRAVTDPNSGLMYIPAGANQGLNMMEYDPVSGTGRNLSIPMAFNAAVTHYAAAWSSQRNSVLMYGGYYQQNDSITFSTLFQYTPSSSRWNTPTTSGENPGSMDGHCMVSAYGGTKMIMFGGQNRAHAPLGGLYILDIQTWTWTKGADIGASLYRNGMACSVSGDYFIAWGGGQFGKYNEALKTPVIYNLKSGQWTTQFGTSTSNPTTGGSNPDGPSKSPVGAMIGGVVAGVVVIAAIGFIVFRRRKSKTQQKDSNAYTSIEPEGGSDHGSKHFTNIHLQNISPSFKDDNQFQPLQVHTPLANTAMDTNVSYAKEAPVYHEANGSGYVSVQSAKPTPLHAQKPPNNPQLYVWPTSPTPSGKPALRGPQGLQPDPQSWEPHHTPATVSSNHPQW
ncbi:hypothetical protein BGX27_011273, partial [Mortierella sp. AM989]